MDSASLVEPLSNHPHLPALASLVRASAIDAAHARRADFGFRAPAGAGPVAGPGHIPEGLAHSDADTSFGNVLDVLERGANSLDERALLGALLALSLRGNEPTEDAARTELATHLIWLAAHTACNALPALDAALQEQAEPLWFSLAELIEHPEQAPSDFSRTELLVAASALRGTSNAAARKLRFELYERTADPEIYALLAPGPEDPHEELSGEMQHPPRGPLLTIIMTFTLVLFIVQTVRLIGRYAFAYKRPAILRIGRQGLELSHRIELMGRVLRDRAIVLPLTGIVRVTREVRYARAGLYVGLTALTVGTYLGTGLLVDGLRVPGGSGPLLGLAAVFIIVGLAVDFVLSSAADTLRGRCRLIVVPIRGKRLCIGALEAARADALLAALAERIQRREEPVRAEPQPEQPEAPPPVAPVEPPRAAIPSETAESSGA